LSRFPSCSFEFIKEGKPCLNSAAFNMPCYLGEHNLLILMDYFYLREEDVERFVWETDKKRHKKVNSSIFHPAEGC
jgi:hypothetical protein